MSEASKMLKKVLNNQLEFQKEIADSHKALWMSMGKLESKLN